jgi:hypothetical protein
MKKHIDNMAKYTALILISALPFAIEVLADSDKEQYSATSLANTKKDILGGKRKVSEDD